MNKSFFFLRLIFKFLLMCLSICMWQWPGRPEEGYQTAQSWVIGSGGTGNLGLARAASTLAAELLFQPPVNTVLMVLFSLSICQAHAYSLHLLPVPPISKSQLVNPNPDIQTQRHSTLNPEGGMLAFNIRGRAFKWKTNKQLYRDTFWPPRLIEQFLAVFIKGVRE